MCLGYQKHTLVEVSALDGLIVVVHVILLAVVLSLCHVCLFLTDLDVWDVGWQRLRHGDNTSSLPLSSFSPWAKWHFSSRGQSSSTVTSCYSSGRTCTWLSCSWCSAASSSPHSLYSSQLRHEIIPRLMARTTYLQFFKKDQAATCS
jgi:hypothetical protein